MNLKMNIKNLIKMRAMFVAIATICCMSFFVFTGCQEEDRDDGMRRTVHDPSKPVIVTSFSPDSGRISEMVLLDGANFGSDTSNLRVYFNSKKAQIINSTGTRILALVPRLPGDTCILSVEAGGKKATYPDLFRYKVEATASTLVGNGNHDLKIGTLDDSQFGVVYLGIDKEDNIFASIDNEGGKLLKISEKDNSVLVVATYEQGMCPRFQIFADPETEVIMMGGEGPNSKDRFLFCDPKEAYSPKNRYIKEWITNGYTMPYNNNGVGEQNYETHYHCLMNRIDGCLYTRYTGGQLVKINPKTWGAEIIYMTLQGVVCGMAFHPTRHNELWMGYTDGVGGHGLYTLDVTDPEGTFVKVSGPTGVGFRDGRLDQAQFNNIRQINFDEDGSLFVGDSGNDCIRRVDTENMMVETVIGIPQTGEGYVNGKKENARFAAPHGLVVNSEGVIFVGDHHNNMIRRVAIE
jgi:hypothetical protein